MDTPKTPEQLAAAKYNHSLKICFGGEAEATVYFNIEVGDLPSEWIVSETLQVFYKDIDITDLFDGSDIDEHIYMKSNEVERQLEDRQVETMAEYHHQDHDD